MAASLDRFIVGVCENEGFTAVNRFDVIEMLEERGHITWNGSDMEHDIISEALDRVNWVWVLRQIAPPWDSEEEDEVCDSDSD